MRRKAEKCLQSTTPAGLEPLLTSCFLGLSSADLATIDAHAGRMDYQPHDSPADRAVGLLDRARGAGCRS
jgi:hypothetical protein